MEEGGKIGACHKEMGDGMHCIHHSHTSGGICAFCLEEKLGKLLSSSFPSPSPFPSPSITPSPPPTSINNIILKRSKSSVTPKRNQFLHDLSPTKRNSFWSFLYPSSKEVRSFGPAGKSKDKCVVGQQVQRNSDHVIMEQEDKCLSSKISRSRSIGCGNRSFSAEFFGKISSGLADCTLPRPDSQREGKSRVSCGGIFGAFILTSSSLSSSADNYSKGRTWGWPFATPSKPSSSKTHASSQINATPNLSPIPSFLTVRG